MKTHINLVKALKTRIKQKTPANKMIVGLNLVVLFVVLALASVCIALGFSAAGLQNEANSFEERYEVALRELMKTQGSFDKYNKMKSVLVESDATLNMISNNPEFVIEIFDAIDAILVEIKLTLPEISYNSVAFNGKSEVAIKFSHVAGVNLDDSEKAMQGMISLSKKLRSAKYDSDFDNEALRGQTIFSSTSVFNSFEQEGTGIIDWDFSGVLRAKGE